MFCQDTIGIYFIRAGRRIIREIICNKAISCPDRMLFLPIILNTCCQIMAETFLMINAYIFLLPKRIPGYLIIQIVNFPHFRILKTIKRKNIQTFVVIIHFYFLTVREFVVLFGNTTERHGETILPFLICRNL